MSLEPGLVLGRAALELDWSEKPCLLRALWRFGPLIAAGALAFGLSRRESGMAASVHQSRRCPGLSGARRRTAEPAAEAAVEVRHIAESAYHGDVADPHAGAPPWHADPPGTGLGALAATGRHRRLYRGRRRHVADLQAAGAVAGVGEAVSSSPISDGGSFMDFARIQPILSRWSFEPRQFAGAAPPLGGS